MQFITVILVCRFLNDIVDQFTVGTGDNDARISLVKFGNDARVIFDLTE